MKKWNRLSPGEEIPIEKFLRSVGFHRLRKKQTDLSGQKELRKEKQRRSCLA